MRRMTCLLCVVTTVLALDVASALGATITFIDTRSAFNSATTNLTNINFENIVPTNASQNFLNPGLTTSGVNFFTSGTGPFGPGFVTVYGAGLAAMQSPVLNTGTGAILVWGPPNQPGTAFLNAVLPAGTTAVGADFWAQQPFLAAVDVTVNASDATSQTVTINTANRPTASFVGFTSDVPISSILFRTAQGQTGLVVDNFSSGQTMTAEPVPQVPEPFSAVLVSCGLAGLALFKKAIARQPF